MLCRSSGAAEPLVDVHVTGAGVAFSLREVVSKGLSASQAWPQRFGHVGAATKPSDTRGVGRDNDGRKRSLLHYFADQ
jgi:hypothetical protein